MWAGPLILWRILHIRVPPVSIFLTDQSEHEETTQKNTVHVCPRPTQSIYLLRGYPLSQTT